MAMHRPAAFALSLLAGVLVLAPLADASGAPAKRRTSSTNSSSAKASVAKAKGSTPSSAKASVAKAKGSTSSSAKASVAKAKRSSGKATRAKESPGGRNRTPASHAPRAGTLPILGRVIECPADMVAVAGRVCVDRYETSVVDAATGADWSPFFTPDLGRARTVAAFYEDLRTRRAPSSLAASLELPPLPEALHAPRATSRPGVLPQGYLSAEQADALCRAAGKRLCTESEWLTACRGQERRDFPYGARYEHGTCNVWRESHPSSLLHGNASRYHDDPRNGRVAVGGRPFLLPTGTSPRCASRWGDDAIHDMVGNLDEWVADPGGVFLGGFYARASRAGCLARVSNHVRAYSDYSTGTRCCADPSLPG